MLKKIVILGLLFAFAGVFAHADHATLFKVRVENISTADLLKSSNGATAPAGLSPGLFILHNGKNPIFKMDRPTIIQALERLAEDGNPAELMKALQKEKGVTSVVVFDTPVGADEAGPIGPGGAYEFVFSAHPGTKLSFAEMFGQSNDLFYSDAAGIELFDQKGNPIKGDITANIELWDAGTEVNQEPGFGPDQAPRQAAPNTGQTEKKMVERVKDQFTYPSVKQVLRITISHS